MKSGERWRNYKVSRSSVQWDTPLRRSLIKQCCTRATQCFSKTFLTKSLMALGMITTAPYSGKSGLRVRSQGASWVGPRLWLAQPSMFLGFRRSYVMLQTGGPQGNYSLIRPVLNNTKVFFSFLFPPFTWLSLCVILPMCQNYAFLKKKTEPLWHTRPYCRLWSCNASLSSWLEACSLIWRWA